MSNGAIPIVAAIATLAAAFLVSRDKNKEIYIQAITNERAKWRELLRNEVAEFIATAVILAKAKQNELALASELTIKIKPAKPGDEEYGEEYSYADKLKYEEKFVKLYHLILSRINPYDANRDMLETPINPINQAIQDDAKETPNDAKETPINQAILELEKIIKNQKSLDTTYGFFSRCHKCFEYFSRKKEKAPPPDSEASPNYDKYIREAVYDLYNQLIERKTDLENLESNIKLLQLSSNLLIKNEWEKSKEEASDDDSQYIGKTKSKTRKKCFKSVCSLGKFVFWIIFIFFIFYGFNYFFNQAIEKDDANCSQNNFNNTLLVSFKATETKKENECNQTSQTKKIAKHESKLSTQNQQRQCNETDCAQYCKDAHPHKDVLE